MTPKKTTAPSRKLKQGGLASAGVLIALGLAIAINLVASQLFWRVDMTQDAIYTLSEPSRELVASLQEPVAITVFLSPDLPPPFHTLPQRLSDLLTEYQAASGGNLTFEILTIEERGAQTQEQQSEVEKNAAGFGCEKVAIGQETQNEVNIRAVFKCVAFTQGASQQVLRDLRVTGNPERDNLEYHLTKALLNLDASRTRKVGFVRGLGGEVELPNFLDSIKGPFRALYGELIVPVVVDLDAEHPLVPPDVTTLILLDPSRPMEPAGKFALDQFLQRGGSIGWYQSSTASDQVMLSQLAKEFPDRQLPDLRAPAEHNLNDLFGTYGVVHNGDLLVDRANAMTIRAMTEQGPAPVTFAPIFQVNDLDRSLPFLANTPPVIFPTPSSLTLTQAARSERLRVFEAIKTSPTATRHKDLPRRRVFEELAKYGEGQDPGEHLIGVALQGHFASYYENNPLPQGIGEDRLYKGERLPGRVLVIGSGDFFQVLPQIGYDERLSGIGQQLLFSSIEWLAQDNVLSKIREKRLPRYIGEVDSQLQRRIQFINIVFVPSCFALLGSLMMYRRRKRRERLSAPTPTD